MQARLPLLHRPKLSRGYRSISTVSQYRFVSALPPTLAAPDTDRWKAQHRLRSLQRRHLPTHRSFHSSIYHPHAPPSWASTEPQPDASSSNHYLTEELDTLESSLESQLQDIDQLLSSTRPNALPSSRTYTDNDTDPTTPTPDLSTLLDSYDPLHPPTPTDRPVLETQHWFECQAQTESAERYEAVLADARNRRDHASLTIVQRHIVKWYHHLRDRILKEQESYLSAGRGGAAAAAAAAADTDAAHNSDTDTVDDDHNDQHPTTNDNKDQLPVKHKKQRRRIGANAYGPFLCALQAEKLAVLTSHEAVTYALTKGGSMTLVSIANKIGEAVEAEVNVQRLLRKRMMDQKRNIKTRASTQTMEGADEPPDGNATETTVIHTEPILDNHNDDEESSPSSESWTYTPTHLQRFTSELDSLNPSRRARLRIERANRRALSLLNSTEEWTTSQKVKLGGVLLQMLLDTARVDLRDGSGDQPAFRHEKRWVDTKKLAGFVTLDYEFYKLVVEDRFNSLYVYTTRHKPMVVPPMEWVGPRDGGYRVLKVDLMRTHGCQIQKDALYGADLSTVYDGLNVLGRVPWKINKTILKVAQQCWDRNIELGDIPTQMDYVETEIPLRPQIDPAFKEKGVDKESLAYKEMVEELRLYKEAMLKHGRIHQKNMDLRSLRCSAILKLNQAEQFKEFEKIYFPYNVDFRGRAYPIPPHLSNVGSDLCRGMLTFSKSKPLGKRGFYWLKVHLANLFGADKITFDERAAFTEANLHRVRASTLSSPGSNDDIEGSNWWMEADDPFQALATCHEIINAIDSGDPESYECSLPVHMDGSCNGLQHYAALGRDKVGGKAVNLCNYDEPQDVYIGVMEEVIDRVAEDAKGEGLGFNPETVDPQKLSKKDKEKLKHYRAAKLVDGLIDRGVVKRTVMTSVYGVTYIGARKQIQEKIEEKLEDKGIDVDEIESEIHSACGYLASVTMDVMGELFSGARQTMNWLSTCARLIASQGQPVSWMSAIGIPAVQPYRRSQPYTIVTLLQSVVLINNSDSLPVHKQRQASAFPPNYVHSLDSSHMLLTALEMDRRGLEFSAVHDSFWTHPCDIDEMNVVLRDCFVDLYERPLLEDLKRTWEMQYPSLVFPDLPARGSLDLGEVRKAPYFFQ